MSSPIQTPIKEPSENFSSSTSSSLPPENGQESTFLHIICSHSSSKTNKETFHGRKVSVDTLFSSAGNPSDALSFFSPQQSIEQFTQRLTINPNDIEALTHRAYLYFHVNKLDLCLHDLDNILKINPNDSHGCVNRSFVNMLLKKNIPQSISDLNRYATDHFQLNLLEIQSVDFAKLETNPLLPSIFFNFAHLNFLNQNYEKCFSTLKSLYRALSRIEGSNQTEYLTKHLISLFKDWVSSIAYRGFDTFRDKNYAKALGSFEIYLKAMEEEIPITELEELTLEVHLCRGIIRSHQFEDDLAIQDFNIVLAVKREKLSSRMQEMQIFALFHRAVSFYEKDNQVDSLQDFLSYKNGLKFFDVAQLPVSLEAIKQVETEFFIPATKLDVGIKNLEADVYNQHHLEFILELLFPNSTGMTEDLIDHFKNSKKMSLLIKALEHHIAQSPNQNNTRYRCYLMVFCLLNGDVGKGVELFGMLDCYDPSSPFGGTLDNIRCCYEFFFSFSSLSELDQFLETHRSNPTALHLRGHCLNRIAPEQNQTQVKRDLERFLELSRNQSFKNSMTHYMECETLSILCNIYVEEANNNSIKKSLLGLIERFLISQANDRETLNNYISILETYIEFCFQFYATKKTAIEVLSVIKKIPFFASIDEDSSLDLITPKALLYTKVNKNEKEFMAILKNRKRLLKYPNTLLQFYIAALYFSSLPADEKDKLTFIEELKEKGKILMKAILTKCPPNSYLVTRGMTYYKTALALLNFPKAV